MRAAARPGRPLQPALHPPYRQNGADVEPVLYDQAAAYCKRRRAILLVDPPSGWSTVDRAVTGFRAEADELGGRGPNAAVYFPRLRRPNPFKSDAPEDFVPCGAVAGVLARVDGARGCGRRGRVWRRVWWGCRSCRCGFRMVGTGC
ncbi:hypothetical protein ACFQ0M_09225 [Kitasatospora aburaviensis]